MAKIGVFPASGGLGTSIINHLIQLVPASELVLIARHPDKLTELANAGATVRRADYDDPESLEGVFEGIETLMLISYASFEIEHRIQAHKKAIDAAVQNGVKHIFYSSLGFGGDLQDTSVAHVMGAHLATEKYLAEQSKSGSFTYTSVREGLYSESYPIYTNWFDVNDPTGTITIPHDGTGRGVTWVKRDELGEATAKMIVSYVQNSDKFEYVNRAVLLSGSKEFSLQETVEVLGRVVGKPVQLQEISVDEYAALPHGGKHTYHGKELSREWATAWEAIRRGETAVVSPVLGEILGREPEGFEDTVRGLKK